MTKKKTSRAGSARARQRTERATAPSNEPVRKHRMLCASRWAWVGKNGEAVNCGLPCDCDNPGKLVEIPA